MWRRVGGWVVRVVVVMVVGGTWNVQYVVAGDGPSDQRWHSSDELLQNGQLTAPQPILEVNFRYDADATPSLTLKQLHIKQGYAPQYDPLQSGYVLSLHNGTGDVLSSLTFQVPNVISNPPPQPGEAPGEGSLVLRKMDFSLTVPLPPDAVELRVTDSQGVLVIHQSLQGVPVQHNAPNFRSYQHRNTPGSRLPRVRSRFAWLFDLFMETAEAATDGTLDIAFVGDNYTAADLTLYHQDIDRAIAHMMTYEPYKTRASQVLFHSVDNTSVDLGCVHDATVTRLIVCNNLTVTNVVNSAGAPHDRIIVLVNDPNYGGSGGAIAVSYNGGSEPQVVAHEFGHTFGNLIDEYLLYSTNGTLDGTVHANCYAGTPPATAWNGLVALTDYVLSCNYPNWYRSSPCSIMLQLSCQYFNAVSQRQLNTQLDLYAGSISPTVNLSANPTTVGAGGSSTLSWTSANVTSCTASSAWSGSKPTTSSETVTPASTSSYTLACSGAYGSAAQTVTVTVDAQPPTVSLTAPTDGTTVSGTVTVSASASDNQSVSRVDFYKDSALLGSDNSAPYSLNWNTSGESTGTHTLTSQALDGAGNLSSSAPVGVTVSSTTNPRRGRKK